jgi:hypothetical protein
MAKDTKTIGMEKDTKTIGMAKDTETEAWKRTYFMLIRVGGPGGALYLIF